MKPFVSAEDMVLNKKKPAALKNKPKPQEKEEKKGWFSGLYIPNKLSQRKWINYSFWRFGNGRKNKGKDEKILNKYEKVAKQQANQIEVRWTKLLHHWPHDAT